MIDGWICEKLIAHSTVETHAFVKNDEALATFQYCPGSKNYIVWNGRNFLSIEGAKRAIELHFKMPELKYDCPCVGLDGPHNLCEYFPVKRSP